MEEEEKAEKKREKKDTNMKGGKELETETVQVRREAIRKLA